MVQRALQTAVTHLCFCAYMPHEMAVLEVSLHPAGGCARAAGVSTVDWLVLGGWWAWLRGWVSSFGRLCFVHP